MEGKMKVAVMTGARQMEWTEKDIPKPGKGELLVKLEYVGVCGSDLHFYEAGRLGNWVPDGPLVLGHEPGGVVEEVGPEVTGLKKGDRIAIEPGVPCGTCDMCRKGLYNLCPDMSFMAIPNERDGVFSEYCVHPANMCFKLPDNVDTMEGALIEPLAVGFHAAKVAEAEIGQSAVVLGCGCIGLVTIMVLKARGIEEIYAVDMIGKRLEKAKEVGAKEGDLKTIFRYRNLYPAAIKAVSEGTIPLKSIVSHIFEFKDVIEGVAYNVDNKSDVIKAVVKY